MWVTRLTRPLAISGWNGPMWVEFVSGEIREGAWAVQIGHATPDRQGAVFVGTVDPEGFARFRAASEQSDDVVVAQSAMFMLKGTASVP